MNFPEGTVLTRFIVRVITIWEIPRSFILDLLQCIYFQNTCFLPASAKLAVNYRPSGNPTSDSKQFQRRM